MTRAAKTAQNPGAKASSPETSLYYYRARYYDPAIGKFNSEDPAGFAASPNFYRYVGNNPVKRIDPRGLWQVTVGGGLGLGALATFGNNNGQFNFGVYTGVGEGGFFDIEPEPSEGCHKFGASGETKAHGGVGLGGYVEVDDTVPWDGSPANLDVHVQVPNVGGISWSPDKPLERPRGVIGGGEGGFGGIGFHFYSPPSQCGCPGE